MAAVMDTNMLLAPTGASTTFGQKYSDLKANVKMHALNYGNKYAPNFTAHLTKDRDPRLEHWQPMFTYTMLIVYMFVNLLQFVDIFSNDSQLLMGLSGVRILVYLVSAIFAGTSIYMGWRTVEISMIFQMINITIYLLTGLGVAITRSVVVFQQMKTTERNWFTYVSIAIPCIQAIISAFALYFMYQAYQNDADKLAEVGMIAVFFGSIFGIISASVGFVKHASIYANFPN